MNNNLAWTGERLITDETLGTGVIDHLHRYALASNIVKSKIVLDIASGEGYGSNLLAQFADYVTGVDISNEAVNHANQKYSKNNLKFKQGSVINIPMSDNSIDVVVSFETIEHLLEQDEMLKEIRRVLKTDGVLLISSPEKSYGLPNEHRDKFHVKELTELEFISKLKEQFSNIQISYQRYISASVIYQSNISTNKLNEYIGDFQGIEKKDFTSNRVYNIAICSNSFNSENLDGLSFFNGHNVLQKINELEIEKAFQLGKQTIRQTNSYKIGNLIMKPFSIFKKLVNK